MLNVRSINKEVREHGEDESHAEGLGIVTDEFTEIMPGFRERIQSGSIERADTVKSYFNHDPSMVLSTTRSSPPLTLTESGEGLRFSAPIPDTSYGRDLRENLRNGNVQGASFSFMVPEGGDRMWEESDGTIHRDISRLTLFEVGPVTDPAYVQTSAELNSAKQALQEARDSGRIAGGEAQEQREEESQESGEQASAFDISDYERLARHGRIMAELDK